MNRIGAPMSSFPILARVIKRHRQRSEQIQPIKRLLQKAAIIRCCNVDATHIRASGNKDNRQFWTLNSCYSLKFDAIHNGHADVGN